MNDTLEHVRRKIDKFEVGEARSAGGLTLVPLFGGEPAPDYFVASEAFGLDLLQIEEVGSGDVPNLTAINHAQIPVLLLDGEHLVGAKQNRIINVTVLLAPQSKTILPVSCVEAGRWHYDQSIPEDERGRFSTSGDHSYARLRRAQAEMVAQKARFKQERRADQGPVWDEVALKQREMGVKESAYGAMHDAFEHRRKDLAEMRKAFERPVSRQTGVIAFAGGQPVALDAFDQAETLTKVWSRLVSGYSLDALGTDSSAIDETTVRAFLGEANEALPTAQEGIGLGTDVVLGSDRIVGNALVFEGTVVHMALFAKDIPAPRGGRIQRPTKRARRFFHSEY